MNPQSQARYTKAATSEDWRLFFPFTSFPLLPLEALYLPVALAAGSIPAPIGMGL
jgi:hypothetical protein